MVARLAERLEVLPVVRTALRQWRDVIDLGCYLGTPALLAHHAQRMLTQKALTLALPRASAGSERLTTLTVLRSTGGLAGTHLRTDAMYRRLLEHQKIDVPVSYTSKAFITALM